MHRIWGTVSGVSRWTNPNVNEGGGRVEWIVITVWKRVVEAPVVTLPSAAILARNYRLCLGTRVAIVELPVGVAWQIRLSQLMGH